MRPRTPVGATVALAFCLLGFLGACGARDALDNGPLDASRDSDDLDRAPPCASTSPFGFPIAIPLAFRDNDRRPTLTADERILVVGRGTFDFAKRLFTATRTNGTFGDLTPVFPTRGGPLPAYSNQAPSISADGLTLYFLANVPASCGALNPKCFKLHITQRAATTTSFEEPIAITPGFADVDLAGSTGSPSLSADGQTLYYDLKSEIHRRVWSGTEWIADETLREIGEAHDPAISADGRTLFFARSNGDHDLIWSAARAVPQGPFGQPRRVEELVPPISLTNIPGWVSPDGCRLYFSRHLTASAATGAGIFVAERGRY